VAGLVAQEAGPGVEGAVGQGGRFAEAFEGGGGFGGDADAGQAEGFAGFDHQARDGGVEVHVFVGVGVVELQAGGGVGGELGVDFGAKLAAGGGGEEVFYAQGGLVLREFAVRRGDVREGGVAEEGGAVDQDEVEAGVQGGEGFGAGDGVLRGGGGDHEAGLGEDAVLVRLLHRLVDRDGEAKVIGGEDGVLHRGVQARACRLNREAVLS